MIITKEKTKINATAQKCSNKMKRSLVEILNAVVIYLQSSKGYLELEVLCAHETRAINR